MPAIEYTVLRSIIRVPLNAESKSDISVNVAGSPQVFSYDSVAGDFAGLNAGEWVLTAGFSDSLNNGWSQLSINSTANKITVTKQLAVEAAGNPINVTGYLYGLNELVSTDFRFQVDNRERVVKQNQAIALNGNRETLTERREQYFNIVSGVLDSAGLALLVQFLDSCESGESFVFDRNGTVASPDNPLSSILDGSGYTEQRLATNIDYRIGFRIKLQ